MANMLTWRSLSLCFILSFSILFGKSIEAGVASTNDPEAHSFGIERNWDYNVTQIQQIWGRQASKPPLRILTAGASIMWGLRSTDLNGCRKHIRDALRYKGFEVDMVGITQNGKMKDNDVSATPGNVIDDVHEEVSSSIGYKPNVVVINVGSNDADLDISPGTAGVRMDAILQTIWNTKDYENPNACIILSTLSLISNANGAKYSPMINQQYRDLVTKYSAAGKCIYLADLRTIDPATGKEWIQFGTDIGPDGLHPTDQGYAKMGSIYSNGIMAAYKDGKIVDPLPIDLTAVKSCPKKVGGSVKLGGNTQLGSGTDDGIYFHDTQGMGSILEVVGPSSDVKQWFTAKLVRPDRDDILSWHTLSNGDQRFQMWRNVGNEDKASFLGIGDLNTDLFCNPAGVNFVDMNGDGLDDLVCINAVGNAYLSINQGDGTNSKPPSFKQTTSGVGGLIMPGKAPQRYIRMADIDGDGRADYIWVRENTEVHVWRNGGTADYPEYWQSLGIRAMIDNHGDADGVRFADITGGNGDDWLWVSDSGETYTWTNARSCLRGKLGDGLNVAWRQGFHKGQTSGPTHYGLADYQKQQNGSIRDAIHFAKIYGSSESFGVRPRSDYIYFNVTKLTAVDYRWNVLAYKSLGIGGAKLKIDGDKYCNMMGHSNGEMDYVWTWSDGHMDMYPNAGKKTLTAGESFWGPKVTGMWSPRNYVDRDLDRRDLHLADWDGDGACDIIWTDPDNDNKVSVWLNKYPTTGTWHFEYLANPAPELSCKEKRGRGVNDLAVRLVDFTGNGLTDYMCIEPNGRVTGFTHTVPTFTNVGQIKFPQTKDPLDRANLRWSDVDGDGKPDMVHIDKFTGNINVWYNKGLVKDAAANGGSAISWLKSGEAYVGSYAGTCQYLPDLDGNGRADLHSIINVFTNMAVSWLSNSCGLGDATGDDTDSTSNPNLPVVPSSDGGIPGSGGGLGGGSGEGSGVVYINPMVWNVPTAQCEDPCVLVWPPSQLPALSTFTIPPYTTSLEVGTTTTTITLNIPPIVTGQVPMSNNPITPGEDPTVIQPLPSITLPDTQWPLTFVSGGVTSTTTRTIQLPPWPQITMGPPEGWAHWSETAAPPPTTSSDAGAIIFPTPGVTQSSYSTTVGTSTTTTTDEPLPIWTVFPWGTIEPIEEDINTIQVVDPEDTKYGGLGVKVPCHLWFFNFCLNGGPRKIGGWHWILPPGIIGPGPPPWWQINFGFGTWEFDDVLPPWPRITIGNDGTPTFPTEPEGPCETKEASVCPVATILDDGTTSKTTYFQDITECITFSGCWDTDLEPTVTSDVCTIDGKRQKVSTTMISTTSVSTETSLGTTLNSAVPAAAPAKTTLSPETRLPSVTSSASTSVVTSIQQEATNDQDQGQLDQILSPADVDNSTHHVLRKRAPNQLLLPFNRVDQNDPMNWVNDNHCQGDVKAVVCFPAQRTNDISLQLIRDRLNRAGLDFTEARAPSVGYTAFFFMPRMAVGLQSLFNQMFGNIALCYHKTSPGQIVPRAQRASKRSENIDTLKRAASSNDFTPSTPDNRTDEGHLLHKRVSIGQWSNSYPLAQLSYPFHIGENPQYPGVTWLNDPTAAKPNGFYAKWADDTQGDGQFIYIIDRNPTLGNHPEFTSAKYPPIILSDVTYYPGPARAPADHGSQVGGCAGGALSGAAPKAQLIFTSTAQPEDWGELPYFQRMILVIEDMMANPNRIGASVINMSWGVTRRLLPSVYGTIMQELLEIIHNMGGFLIAAASNTGQNARVSGDVYPAYFAGYGLSGKLLLVGSVNEVGTKSAFSVSWLGARLYAYAGGEDVYVVSGTGPYYVKLESGTSFSAPLVAGLAAYLRGLPSKWKNQLRTPEVVRNLIIGLSRQLAPGQPKVVWNAQQYYVSCLLVDDLQGCPKLPDDLLSVPCQAEQRTISFRESSPNPDLGKRIIVYSDFCWPTIQFTFNPPPPGGGSGNGGGGALGGLMPTQITWQSGAPQPTCAAAARIGEAGGPAAPNPLIPRADACGQLCEGYYCVPQPNGHGPSYADPANAPPPPPPNPYPVTSTLGNGEVIGCTDSRCTSTVIISPPTGNPNPFPFTTTRGSGEVDACSDPSCATVSTVTPPFPFTTTRSNGEVDGCSDNKCTSTILISPPTPAPTPTPCAEFHCFYINDRGDGLGVTLYAQVFEDGNKVCDVEFGLSHDGPWGTRTWGASTMESGGCLSDDYELSITAQCESYTYSHFSAGVTTSFASIQSTNVPRTCDGCTDPVCVKACSDGAVCAKGGDNTCLAKPCNLCLKAYC